MIDQLSNFIIEQKLFQPEQKILLAVSGGIDSMVMVDLFQQADYNYAIAHCNFNLRGEESDHDQKLVESTAKKHQVACFVKSFQTEDYAKSNGISIQMAARDLRNSWFEQLTQDESYDFIALAHHLNDSLETVIFNLTKGTGIEGLKGISPKTDQFIRPLMFATREMIEGYAKTHHITWREDRSNESDKYHRNKIRLNVLPELRKINPSLEETYSYSRERIAAAARLFNKNIQKNREAITEETSGGLQIDKIKLSQFEEPLILLYEILKDYGFNFQQTKNVLEIMDQKSGKRFFSDDYQLVIDRNFLFLFVKELEEEFELTIQEDTEKVDLPDRQISFDKVDAGTVEFGSGNQILFLDFEKLAFPLKIRNWQPGDRFQPLGMTHKKKLSDFMIDKKIPLNLKNRVMVITSSEDLVCVVGYRIDERYKLTKSTRTAFKISNQQRDD